jgi:hypothetical protein
VSAQRKLEKAPTNLSQFLAWTAEKKGNKQRPDEAKERDCVGGNDCKTPYDPRWQRAGRVATRAFRFRPPSFLWPGPPAPLVPTMARAFARRLLASLRDEPASAPPRIVPYGRPTGHGLFFPPSFSSLPRCSVRPRSPSGTAIFLRRALHCTGREWLVSPTGYCPRP